MLPAGFFDQDADLLAQALLGKLIRHRITLADGRRLWLAARIIETEAYEKHDKASHSSLGFTEARRAVFMPAGTIYMYYARGGDSLNFSASGAGNAVLIKSGYAWQDRRSPVAAIETMHQLNPGSRGPRPTERLCSGQTLLCRALGLKVPEWNARRPVKSRLVVEDVGATPTGIIQCRRLGIPAGRDEHLLKRYVDADYARYATSNPLTRRAWLEGVDYHRISPPAIHPTAASR